METGTTSVVIPTLNAGVDLPRLLEVLEAQTVLPDEIIVVDSASEDRTPEIAAANPLVKLVSIERADFNHGMTRDMAFRLSQGDYVCFLTQDALPASTTYLECLINPMLKDERIALVSGRQLPKADARRFEQLVREFNYPVKSAVRSLDDLPSLGIKTFFASDVCSAYRRTAYLECGGFPMLETNEDMLMAARFIGRGYLVAYEASAQVYHSHNLTLREQFRRNRLVGRFLELNNDDLLGASEIGEGMKMVKAVTTQLVREGALLELWAFFLDCAARLFGNQAGRRSSIKERRPVHEN